MELEAAALLRLGKPAEAEATAFRMAAAAPYDLITFLRARASVRIFSRMQMSTPYSCSSCYCVLYRSLPSSGVETKRYAAQTIRKVNAKRPSKHKGRQKQASDQQKVIRKKLKQKSAWRAKVEEEWRWCGYNIT
jgi:hypothetical protein